MALVGAAIARLFPLVPRPVARRLSARYIAGTTTEEAIRVALRLQNRSLLVTLDVLGESVNSAVEASSYAGKYVSALEALHSAGLQPHVSVKPSSLGSLYDWRECEDHVVRITEAARTYGGSVCLDMESSGTVEATLALYRALRSRGFDNIGAVVQARLHRTRNDLQTLGSLAPEMRICKGIYPEPARIAWRDGEAIRRNYIFCLDTLLAANGYAAIATHDEALIVAALERLNHHGARSANYEFQMLLGVRNDLAEGLAAAGHRVRIYVPYGADWHQYAARRFRESPHVLGYVLRAIGGRLVSRVSTRSASEPLEPVDSGL